MKKVEAVKAAAATSLSLTSQEVPLEAAKTENQQVQAAEVEEAAALRKVIPQLLTSQEVPSEEVQVASLVQVSLQAYQEHLLEHSA